MSRRFKLGVFKEKKGPTPLITYLKLTKQIWFKNYSV